MQTVEIARACVVEERVADLPQVTQAIEVRRARSQFRAMHRDHPLQFLVELADLLLHRPVRGDVLDHADHAVARAGDGRIVPALGADPAPAALTSGATEFDSARGRLLHTASQLLPHAVPVDLVDT